MTLKYSIYVYQCPKTFEFFYVGKDSSYGSRGNRWIPPHSMGPVDKKLAKLQRWGLKPLIHRLLEYEECNNSGELLKQAEIYWIAEGRKRGWPLMNGTEGGDGTAGRVVSEETRGKLRKGRLGKKHSKESRAKISKARKKSKASEETRKKISEKNRGRICSEVTREKIRKSHKSRPFKDQYGTVYESIRQAGERLGILPGGIWNALNGRSKSAMGYVFEYLALGENNDQFFVNGSKDGT